MHIQLKYLVCSVFLLVFVDINAQTTCEKVYTSSEVDLPAEMPLSSPDFVKFVNKEIAPILSKNETLVPKLIVLFTISDEAEITTVEFPTLEAKQQIHKDLANAFRKMGKWKPALIKEKKVCSEFTYPISCFKWQ